MVGGLEIASEIREIDDKSYIIFVTSHPECKNDIFFVIFLKNKRNTSTTGV